MDEKILGIIGGMGPEATVYLFNQIIKETPAGRDQDHLHIIIDCNPKIPDRTGYILGKGPDPTPAIIKSAKNLESLGVTVAGIPCVTAHYFFPQVQHALSYTLLNILEELGRRIRRDYPHVARVGILATSGTVKTRLYDQYLPAYTIIYPSKAIQEDNIMEAIYGTKGIKKGNLGDYPLQLLTEAGQELIAAGAEILVAGCTEIPLILKPQHFNVPLLDPVTILAEALVAY